MANFSSDSMKAGGPNAARINCDQVVLVKNPVKGESFAAFSAKVIASAAIDSTDFTIGASGNNLLMTVAVQPNVASTGAAASSDDLCVALVDSEASEVYLVLDAVNRTITAGAGDTVTIPELRYTVFEPTPEV